jgi:hypothetical protein
MFMLMDANLLDTENSLKQPHQKYNNIVCTSF